MTISEAGECPPILLIVFKRPETTRQVMDAIRKARPKKLYVAADGPRLGREGEAEACEAARKVATKVDWPCETFTLFRDKNVGCKLGPTGAIDWFFEHEPEGIILEDDVVPVQSFFRFCAELLERYRYDTRISAIAGANLPHNLGDGDTSYYFSRLTYIWGWASWRRAWVHYDRDMSQWTSFKRRGGFRQLRLDGAFEDYYAPNFEAVASGELVDAWDYQWAFSALVQNTLAILPQVNMVRNVGFGADATHTIDPTSSLSRLESRESIFPLVHPTCFVPRLDADLDTIKKFRPSLSRRLLQAAKRKLLRKSQPLI